MYIVYLSVLYRQTSCQVSVSTNDILTHIVLRSLDLIQHSIVDIIQECLRWRYNIDQSMSSTHKIVREMKTLEYNIRLTIDDLNLHQHLLRLKTSSHMIMTETRDVNRVS